MRPADTSPDAWAVHVARLREMSIGERAQLVVAMSEMVEELTVTGIRLRHPDYTQDQILMALRRLRHGDDLTRAAWPGAEYRRPDASVVAIIEPVGLIVGLLERFGIPSMLTGSVVSSVYGEPRATQNVDFVIDPQPEALGRFLRALDRSSFYVSDDGARRALKYRDMFNMIDTLTSWKIDLMIRKDRPFSREEFDAASLGRRARVRLAIASPRTSSSRSSNGAHLLAPSVNSLTSRRSCPSMTTSTATTSGAGRWSWEWRSGCVRPRSRLVRRRARRAEGARPHPISGGRAPGAPGGLPGRRGRWSATPAERRSAGPAPGRGRGSRWRRPPRGSGRGRPSWRWWRARR